MRQKDLPLPYDSALTFEQWQAGQESPQINEIQTLLEQKEIRADTDALRWALGAICVGKDDLMCRPDNENINARRRRENAAKEVCLPCPVREECLEFALKNDHDYHVWGGHGELERQKLKARRAVASE